MYKHVCYCNCVCWYRFTRDYVEFWYFVVAMVAAEDVVVVVATVVIGGVGVAVIGRVAIYVAVNVVVVCGDSGCS